MNVARSFASELWKEWSKDNIPRHAAAIAYYAVFSLPALLLVVLSVASALLGKSAVNDELFGTVRLYLGDRTADLLERTLANARVDDAEGAWATLAGAALLLVAATGVIRELQASLNKTIDASPARRSIFSHVAGYAVYLVLLLVTAAVLIASIVSGTLIGVLSQRVELFLTFPVEALALIHHGVTYAALTVMIFTLYFFLPAKRFHPVIVLLSSVIASSLLVIATVAASYVVSRTGIGQAYGVAANVLVLLFWIFLGTNIFLLGAEIMQVSDRLHRKSRKRRSRLARLLRI